MTDADIVGAYERAVEDVRMAIERRDSLRVQVEAVIRRSGGAWHSNRRYTLDGGIFCTATHSGGGREGRPA